MVDECPQPHRQDVLGETQASLELTKTATPEQRVPNNQQRPPVAHYVK
jgi:hypothetical protein